MSLQHSWDPADIKTPSPILIFGCKCQAPEKIYFGEGDIEEKKASDGDLQKGTAAKCSKLQTEIFCLLPPRAKELSILKAQPFKEANLAKCIVTEYIHFNWLKSKFIAGLRVRLAAQNWQLQKHSSLHRKIKLHIFSPRQLLCRLLCSKAAILPGTNPPLTKMSRCP